MKRLVLLCVGLSVALMGCDDPRDPATWTKKLRDPQHRERAVLQLKKMAEKAKDPKELAKIGKVAVPALREIFKTHPEARTLKTIILFKDRSAVPTYIDALDFVGEEYHNATVAARALAALKATDAVDALGKVLDRALVKQSRANLAKQAAIEALGKIGDPKAVPYLSKCARKHWQRDDQDFLLNRKAIEALGKIGDKSAVDTLILGLFMSSRRGHSFNQARLALVRIGKPAIKPLIASLQGKNEELKKMAREEEFRPGVVRYKTSFTLGDLRAREAVPVMTEMLSKAKITGEYEKGLDGLIAGLGKIGDEAALPTLHKLIKDKKTAKMIRMYIASSLMTIGSEKSLPVLLELAEKGDVPGMWNGKKVKDPEIRGACARIYAQVAGDDGAKNYDKFVALSKEKRLEGWAAKATFVESIKLMNMAKECKDDALCYGKKLEDTKLKPAERIKAAVMVARVPNGRKAISSFTKVVTEQDNPLLRQILLLGATRIVQASDKAFVDTLTKVEAKEGRRKNKFTGGTGIHNSIALQLIKRKKSPTDAGN